MTILTYLPRTRRINMIISKTPIAFKKNDGKKQKTADKRAGNWPKEARQLDKKFSAKSK